MMTNVTYGQMDSCVKNDLNLTIPSAISDLAQNQLDQLDQLDQVDDECFFQSVPVREDNQNFLKLTLHHQEVMKLKLNEDGMLISGKQENYEYNPQHNLLKITTKKLKNTMEIIIDPRGLFISKIVVEHFFGNKVCEKYPFNFSSIKDISRLGRTHKLNGGLIKFNSKQKNKPFLVRSRNLNLDDMIDLSEKLELKKFKPLVSSMCLKKYGLSIKKLDFLDGDFERKLSELREIIKKDPLCSNSFYSEESPRPLVIHLHASGFGGPLGRGSYALEEIKIAKVFGFDFFHPYHKEHPTPLSGIDIFRPIFFDPIEKEKSEVPAIFDFEKANTNVEEIYTQFNQGQKSHEELELILGEKMDQFHFYSPSTMKYFLSDEARKVFDLDEATIHERRVDAAKFTGGVMSLLDILELITEDCYSQVYIHCHGGRHKTGILSLTLRYLEDPRWLYGPVENLRFGLKNDETVGRENLSWDTNQVAFKERKEYFENLPRDSFLKDAWHYLFKPESDYFNPAEVEYISHNDRQVRLSNLMSARDLFHGFYQRDNIKIQEHLKNKYQISLEKLKNIYQRLDAIKVKFLKKF
jgi:hypothetical protein